MIAVPPSLVAALGDDADAVTRLQEDDPFFRARADRYAALEMMIAGLAATATGPAARKRVELLKWQRDQLLGELVAMVTGVWAPAAAVPKRAPEPAVEASPPRPVAWKWPGAAKR